MTHFSGQMHQVIIRAQHWHLEPHCIPRLIMEWKAMRGIDRSYGLQAIHSTKAFRQSGQLARSISPGFEPINVAF